MKKEDIITLIQKEVEGNPEVTNIDISQKYRIPFIIVNMFRRKFEKNM